MPEEVTADAAALRRRKRRPTKKKKVACRKRAAKKLTKRQRKVVERRMRKTGQRWCKPNRRPNLPSPRLPGDGGPHPAVTVPGTVPSAGVPAPPPGPPAPQGSLGSPIAVYSGPFTIRHAERLLWRAGTGPRPGEAAELSALGLEAAVTRLTRPTGSANLVGPEPHDGDGAALAPYQQWGHDVCWWLDRMIRSDQPLVERLALCFHDWFATSNEGVGSARFLLEQSNKLRGLCLGSFTEMVREITIDPAMLIFLNGIENRKGRPNENYARELMELFTLGADRGAYTENDVRELARALTGWRADWVSGVGFTNFRFDPGRHDTATKTVFGRTGAWNWDDACRLVLEHPLHASFFVAKLWSYFIPEPPPTEVATALQKLYVDRGRQIRPVVEAILLSPWFHEGPRMVKPPAVLVAGMHRSLRRPLETDAWAWLLDGAGQVPTLPPDVSGWDEERWLDSNTFQGRWSCIDTVAAPLSLRSPAWDSYPAETPQQAVANARAFWGDPWLSGETVSALEQYAGSCFTGTIRPWQHAQRQNQLRHLIAISPDFQTS